MGEHRLIVEQAWRMFESGERDRAYRVADEVLALDPFDYRASELRLAQLIDHEAYAEARRLCLQLQAANPVSGWLWEQRCVIAYGLGRGGDLVEAGQAWRRADPSAVEAHLRIAEGHELEGDHAAARAALEDGILDFPDDGGLRVALGDWHYRNDDHASARRAYRSAQAIEPGIDAPHAVEVFDGHLDLRLRTLLVTMLAALAIAVPARLGMGGLWGGMVALGLVGAAGWAHYESYAQARDEVPAEHLRGFVERHRFLVAADAGALVAGVLAGVLAFLTDVGAQQVGALAVLAAVAIGAGVGLIRRSRDSSGDHSRNQSGKHSRN